MKSQPVAAPALISDSARGVGIDPNLVAVVPGHSGMESRVAVMLAEGMRMRELVAATERKESTIRFHVKRISSRHALKRQAELVRLILSLSRAPGLRR